MPWKLRPDEAFWIDPAFRGFAGYPTGERAKEANAPEEENEDTSQIEDYGPNDPTTAIIAVWDRMGFRYQRRVGLGDFISLKHAARLVGVDVATVFRWIKAKKMRSSRRRGYVVIRVRDLVSSAKQMGISLDDKMRGRLVVLKSGGIEEHLIRTRERG